MRMSEQEWLACTDPNLMLNHLLGKVTDRKMRLFAVACCRHIWHLLPDRRSRAVIEVAERYADGVADQRELIAARAAAIAPPDQAAFAPYWAANHNLTKSLWNACEAALEAGARAAARSAHAAGADQGAAWDAARAAGTTEQARLLRDVLGNPFRPAAVAPSWLSWRGGLV